MHVKVTAKEWASRLSITPPPGSAGVSRRIEVWGGREQASDSRVSGRFKARFDVWEYRDGRAHFRNGIFTLTNARGQWTGTFFGVSGADGSHYILGRLSGTDAYRGLRYLRVVYDKASRNAAGHLFDIDGWIDRAAPFQREAAATDDVHVKVTGTNTQQVKLLWGGLVTQPGTEQTSDPRTTGKVRPGRYRAGYPDGRLYVYGAYTLVGRLGTWTGRWYGVVTKDRRYIQFVDALGTGDFAGLRYRHVDTGKYPKSAPKTITLAVNGWIEAIGSAG